MRSEGAASPGLGMVLLGHRRYPRLGNEQKVFWVGVCWRSVARDVPEALVVALLALWGLSSSSPSLGPMAPFSPSGSG